MRRSSLLDTNQRLRRTVLRIPLLATFLRNRLSSMSWLSLGRRSTVVKAPHLPSLPVSRRGRLGRRRALNHRQLQALPARIKLDHPHVQTAAGRRQLAIEERDTPLQPTVQLGVHAVVGLACNRALQDDSGLNTVPNGHPRIRLQALQTQADPVRLAVEAQHERFDFLTDVQHLARILDMLPGDLGDVDKAVGPSDIDEGAELPQACHNPPADLAFPK